MFLRRIVMPSPAPSPVRRTRTSRSQRDRNSDRESEREREKEKEKEAAKARKRERAAERMRERQRREERELELATRDQDQDQERREREQAQDRGREKIRTRSSDQKHRYGPSRLVDISPVSLSSSNSTITPASFAPRFGPGPHSPPIPPPKDGGSVAPGISSPRGGEGAAEAALVPVSTIIHPRVAVVLGIPPQWHFVLFVCRLLSLAPACYWGLPRAAGVLVRLGAIWASEIQGLGMAASGGSVDRLVLRLVLDRSERRVLLTEVALASIWVFASAYLSFFFTDCLMSRWLVTYTPQATIIRLLSISAINAYVTSWVLYLAGGLEDPRLLLPAWISIATTLTVMYHITQRKINIRKETSASISVFSIASFISMVSLLIQLQLARTDVPTIPLIESLKQGWAQAGRLAVNVLEKVGSQKMMGV